jgi:TRAP-type C4-dicarboxylate transport system substrate-binding protein
MKFDEVLTHIGKTAHLLANNQFTISLAKWNELTADQQATVQACAKGFEKALDDITLTQEVELEEDMKKNGLVVYTPIRTRSLPMSKRSMPPKVRTPTGPPV